MKLYGLFGKGSGKVGSSVFAITGGEQIVREYNPVVANPNTSAQREARAKFKLLSQLAASLAPAIAFRKKGLVSARNQFIAANISKATYSATGASIETTALDLTGGSRVAPTYTVEMAAGEGAGLNVTIGHDAATGIIAYVVANIKRTSSEADAQLSVVDVKTATAADDAVNVVVNVKGGSEDNVIVVYGVIPSSSSTSTKYEDYNVGQSIGKPSLDDVSKLIESGAVLTANRNFFFGA